MCLHANQSSLWKEVAAWGLGLLSFVLSQSLGNECRHRYKEIWGNVIKWPPCSGFLVMEVREDCAKWVMLEFRCE